MKELSFTLQEKAKLQKVVLSSQQYSKIEKLEICWKIRKIKGKA